MLIYGKQAIIDAMDFHATLPNIRYPNKGISVILCKYNEMLLEIDKCECLFFTSLINFKFILAGKNSQRTLLVNDREMMMT